MGWFSVAGAEDWATEPVVVESPKARDPRLEQPDKPTAATNKPATATVLLGTLTDRFLRIG
jgi:hypothetical protein